MRKPSKHDISEANDIFSKDEPTQKSPEGESPRIQRLAKSGLYINPSDALKFFSTQVRFGVCKYKSKKCNNYSYTKKYIYLTNICTMD